jgi:DNA-binding transcriptional ArsR family regulator
MLGPIPSAVAKICPNCFTEYAGTELTECVYCQKPLEELHKRQQNPRDATSVSPPKSESPEVFRTNIRERGLHASGIRNAPPGEIGNNALLHVLGSEGRLRILLALAQTVERSSSIYMLARRTGMDRRIIRKHVRVLLDAKLVQAKTLGVITAYAVNPTSRPAQKLIELFKEARLLYITRQTTISPLKT